MEPTVRIDRTAGRQLSRARTSPPNAVTEGSCEPEDTCHPRVASRRRTCAAHMRAQPDVAALCATATCAPSDAATVGSCAPENTCQLRVASGRGTCAAHMRARSDVAALSATATCVPPNAAVPRMATPTDTCQQTGHVAWCHWPSPASSPSRW